MGWLCRLAHWPSMSATRSTRPIRDEERRREPERRSQSALRRTISAILVSPKSAELLYEPSERSIEIEMRFREFVILFDIWARAISGSRNGSTSNIPSNHLACRDARRRPSRRMARHAPEDSVPPTSRQTSSSCQRRRPSNSPLSAPATPSPARSSRSRRRVTRSPPARPRAPTSAPTCRATASTAGASSSSSEENPRPLARRPRRLPARLQPDLRARVDGGGGPRAQRGARYHGADVRLQSRLPSCRPLPRADGGDHAPDP